MIIQKKSIWMIPGYLRALEEAGALPVILPLTYEISVLDRALGLCDGVLFTGGQDVAPSVYGQRKLDVCGEVCPERDGEEKYLLERCI